MTLRATVSTNTLSDEQQRYLGLVSPGAHSIDEAVAGLRAEIEAIYGEGMSRRIDEGLSGSFRRSLSGNLDQAGVSRLFADPGYFVNNALNNLQKVAQPDKVSLRVRALAAMAEHGRETLLDFGCGAGAQLLAMRALGCACLCAAEVDDGLLQFVADRFRFRFHEKVGTWNILTGAVPDRLFRAALVLDVFPVIDQPADTISILKRVLLPGGLVIYNIAPISEQQRSRWSYLIGRDPEEIDRQFTALGFATVWRETFADHDLVCKRVV